MQLRDLLPHEIPNAALEDIVTKVQIQSDFTITHADYQPLKLADEIVVSLQNLPIEIQNRYLNLQLRNFLYGIYYNGQLKATLANNVNPDSLLEIKKLENNQAGAFNREFYEDLQKSNCGKGYFDPRWLVVKQESDHLLAVQKDDLTLHIEPERYLQLAEQSANVGDEVAVLMPPNLIEQAYYVAVSDAGLVNKTLAVNINFNFISEGAIALMKSLTQQLNEINIPFTFKVLYDPDNYQRCDCGVLQFESHNYHIVKQILQTVYIANKCLFRDLVPLFTKLLAPGLSLAEEPNNKFTDQENFGMNRCRILANALLEAWQEGDNSQQGKMHYVDRHFSQHLIDLQRPYLNANSEDIYPMLDC